MSLLRAPARLQVGDRVRLIAPGGPIDRERFTEGLKVLDDFGLHSVYDDGIFARDAYFAGSDARRRSELQTALSDPQTRVIWCARGGYGTTRLLPAFSLSMIQQQPRWLIGFSDITALHGLWQRAGFQSLHGANVTSLSDWSETARSQLQHWLFGEPTLCLSGQTVCGREPVQGPVIGGNLTVMAALAGTGYLPSLRGAIVFFEDIGERPYRLDRCLTQLLQSGALTAAVGFVIGQLTACEDPPEKHAGYTALEALVRILEPLGVPILSDVAVGHEPSSWPLPLGASGRLIPDLGSLHIAP